MAGLLAALAAAAPLAAQAGRKCTFVIDNIDREGTRVEPAPGVVNYFAGGNVRLSCAGTEVQMWSDSLASYGGNVVQFIGNVKYRDATMTMDADFGTYYKQDERWEAQGNVVATNRKSGSVIRGPVLNHWRAVRGLRDSAETEATGRPTVTYFPDDSAAQAGGTKPEPYVIVGDHLRFRGSNQVWGRGNVTVNRSDFSSRSDSLALDTGPKGEGTLVGGIPLPTIRGLGADSFTVVGRRIDLGLADRSLRRVVTKDSAVVTRAELELTADTIAMDVADKKLERTEAWGRTRRPVAVSEEYLIKADSLAFDTPGQKLSEGRMYGSAWVGGKVDTTGLAPAEPDSAADSLAAPSAAAADSVPAPADTAQATAAGGLVLDRDWIAGDTVRATFAESDSAGTKRTVLSRIDARGKAQSLYRLRPTRPGGRASLSYASGRQILVVMLTGNRSGVDRVEARGGVSGIQLQPTFPRRPPATADSTAAPPPPTP